MLHDYKRAPLSSEEIRRKIVELAPKYVRINYSAIAREIGITPQLCRYHWLQYCAEQQRRKLSVLKEDSHEVS
ncbi:MAG: hypothetical protein QXW98_06775 [Candidatus Caldarchaeum sp.]